MTFFWGGNRHFDQVKRVEKSPKAERYCTTILLSPCLLQSIFSLFTLIFPYFIQITKQLSNQASVFLAPPPNSLFSLFLFSFFLFIVVTICYIWWFFLFFSSLFLYHSLGDLSTTLEMTVFFLLSFRPAPTSPSFRPNEVRGEIP